MKKALFVSIILVFSLASFAQAQYYNPKYQARSGDKELDNALFSLNVQAEVNPQNFISELSRSFGITKQKIDEMVEKEKMSLADVFIALKIAEISKKPVDTVTEQFKKSKGKGWGVVAKRMGIKPGSPEFHALKNSANSTLEKVKKAQEKAKTKEEKQKQERKQEKTEEKRKDKSAPGLNK